MVRRGNDNDRYFHDVALSMSIEKIIGFDVKTNLLTVASVTSLDIIAFFNRELCHLS